MWSRPWAIPSIFPIIGKIRPFADAAIVGTISRKLASTETNDQSATGPPWPDILGAQRGVQPVEEHLVARTGVEDRADARPIIGRPADEERHGGGQPQLERRPDLAVEAEALVRIVDRNDEIPIRRRAAIAQITFDRCEIGIAVIATRRAGQMANDAAPQRRAAAPCKTQAAIILAAPLLPGLSEGKDARSEARPVGSAVVST